MITRTSLKVSVMLLLIPLVTACVSTSDISLSEKEAAIAGYRLPEGAKPDEAIVYVLRPDMLGYAQRFLVYLDGKRDEGTYVGYTRGKQYLSFSVSVGQHDIFSKAENWSGVTIGADAGEVIFLKQTPQMGFFIGANYLEQIDDVDGRYFMKMHAMDLGTYVEPDLAPVGPPEELAPALIAPKKQVDSVPLDEAGPDPMLGVWEGDNDQAVGGYGERIELKITERKQENYTGLLRGKSCDRAKVELRHLSHSIYAVHITGVCVAKGKLSRDGSSMRGEVNFEGWMGRRKISLEQQP